MAFPRFEYLVLMATAPAITAARKPFHKGQVRARPPGAPAEHHASIDVKASASTIYQLLDPASPGNRFRRRGFEFTETARDNTRFRAVDPNMPDMAFLFDVTERIHDSAIAIRSRGDGGAPIGVFSQSISRYALSPAANDRTQVEVTETMTFVPGLTIDEMTHHELMMKISARLDLLRLKTEAEALA